MSLGCVQRQPAAARPRNDLAPAAEIHLALRRSVKTKPALRSVASVHERLGVPSVGRILRIAFLDEEQFGIALLLEDVPV